MRTRLVDGLEGLQALRPAWEALERPAMLPMQQYIWAEACASAFANQGHLRILILEENGKTVAIAPFVRRDRTPYLEFLGVHELHEPTDVICADESVLPRLAEALRDLKMPLFLR